MVTNKHRGFTLIEVMAALSITLIVLSIVGNVLQVSFKSLPMAEGEYRAQRSIRFAAEVIGKRIEEASAIFTIPVGKLRSDRLTQGWNYFGLSDDRKQIVNYIYKDDVGTHEMLVLSTAEDDAYYEMLVAQDDADNRQLLSFTVRTVDANTNVVDKQIDSTAEALNALQIVDRGTASLPANGFAYRTERRIDEQVVGNITFVIDVSGSMNQKLNGGTAHFSRDKRINKVENALLGYNKGGEVVEGMINELAKENNVELCFVPFSRTANAPNPAALNGNGVTHLFYNPSINREKAALRRIARHLSNLVGGGTNTGDGMRRAFYRNQWFNQSIKSLPEYGSNYTTKDFMIILVDGVTTFASSNGGSGDSRYNLDDDGHPFLTWYSYPGNWNRAGIIGRGGRTDAVTDRYVELIGSRIKTADIEVYVIGFSKNASDLASVNDIARAAGAKPENVYPFTEDLDIDEVMHTIKEDIMKNLWYIRGPEF